MTASEQVERAERAATAVRLRREGHDYRAIAAQLGCAVSTAHTLVTTALAKLPVDDVDTMRRMEAERLEAIHHALWSRVQAGDSRAAAVLVRASKARAQLYGLNTPVRAEMDTGGITVLLDPALLPRPTEELEAEGWSDAESVAS